VVWPLSEVMLEGVWPLWYIPGSMVLHLFFVTSTPFSCQGIEFPQARFVHVHECSSFPNNGHCLMCTISSIHMKNILHWYLASLTLCVPWPLSLLVGQLICVWPYLSSYALKIALMPELSFYVKLLRETLGLIIPVSLSTVYSDFALSWVSSSNAKYDFKLGSSCLFPVPLQYSEYLLL